MGNRNRSLTFPENGNGMGVGEFGLQGSGFVGLMISLNGCSSPECLEAWQGCWQAVESWALR